MAVVEAVQAEAEAVVVVQAEAEAVAVVVVVQAEAEATAAVVVVQAEAEATAAAVAMAVVAADPVAEAGAEATAVVLRARAAITLATCGRAVAIPAEDLVLEVVEAVALAAAMPTNAARTPSAHTALMMITVLVSYSTRGRTRKEPTKRLSVSLWTRLQSTILVITTSIGPKNKSAVVTTIIAIANRGNRAQTVVRTQIRVPTVDRVRAHAQSPAGKTATADDQFKFLLNFHLISVFKDKGQLELL